MLSWTMVAVAAYNMVPIMAHKSRCQIEFAILNCGSSSSSYNMVLIMAHKSRCQIEYAILNYGSNKGS